MVMTIQEAIDELKLEWDVFVAGIDLAHAENNPEFKHVRDANMMAIRSLESWKKVNEEIKGLDWNGDDAYWYGVSDVSAMIDKHLGEVTE